MNLMYPTLIVDNFFSNPDAVVEFANKQSFILDPMGQWPGRRTHCLSTLYPALYETIAHKVFSLFYNLNNESIQGNVSIAFQKVEKGAYDEGWIHVDSSILSFLIYLNKIPSLNSGTSICRLKTDVACTPKHINAQSTKIALYKNQITQEQAKEDKNKWHEAFEETIFVRNVYNRLLVFEGGLRHKAQMFTDMDEDRLTIVGFVNSMLTGNTPIARSRLLD